MKNPSLKERAALAHADTIGKAENNREDWWHRISLTDRERAMGVAGLTRQRAHDPVASFSDAERAQIRSALAVHVSRMELVAQCFNASNTNAFGYLH